MSASRLASGGKTIHTVLCTVFGCAGTVSRWCFGKVGLVVLHDWSLLAGNLGFDSGYSVETLALAIHEAEERCGRCAGWIFVWSVREGSCDTTDCGGVGTAMWIGVQKGPG